MKFAIAVALLISAGTAEAEVIEPWIGRWSIDPAGCTSFGATASTAPLIVSDRNVSWHLGSCRIGKLYKTGQDAHIQGHCSNDGIARDMPISLKPHGDRMTVIWDSKPAGEVKKCK